MSNLKQECEIVQDLLPLYVDDVASSGSKAFVEHHLETCADCRQVKTLLEGSARAEERIHAETSGVLARHKKRERTLAWKIGFGIAALLMLIYLIAMVIMAASGGAFGDGLMLLCGLAIAGGVSAVPLLSEKRKFANAILVTTAAILILEFLYTNAYGGDIWGTVTATIFGISIPFFPVVAYAYPMPGVLKHHKGLVTMLWDSVFAMLTVFTVGIATYGWMPKTKPIIIAAMKGMAVSLIVIWIIFLAARYLHLKNRWMKAGILSLLVGAALFVVQNPVNHIINRAPSTIMLLPNFRNWTEANYNANISAIFLLTGIAVGAVLIGIGFIRNKHLN